ncbi:formin Fus1 [Schizosaccharomyces cryophilus OY26]|uniref:Formin Fus1 n=1 Tax=Schizosaccharomyces cryophilus (strain OY26 / ATCC MYA-4695 / CBS 11777 / NBRC 106824 / NRRL Y48691) TaxID=653667 RepID=S9VR10_SCHCR|nr:formin Fus1 [Schizosaccharomyces cryophilus OY26]EPY50363.1 formin Fus1 [Schizosaccharomyces cryophilus OY26]
MGNNEIRISKPIIKGDSIHSIMDGPPNDTFATSPKESSTKSVASKKSRQWKLKNDDLHSNWSLTSSFLSIEDRNSVPSMSSLEKTQKNNVTDSRILDAVDIHQKCPNDPNLVDELFLEVVTTLKKENQESYSSFFWDPKITLSMENKWAFITNYLIKKDKVLAVKRNESETTTKCSVASYIEKLLDKMPKCKHVESLVVALRTESVTWVRTFFMMDGQDLLLKLLGDFRDTRYPKITDANLELAVLKCLRCLMNHEEGVLFYIDKEYMIEPILLCLLKPKLSIRKISAEILTFLCYWNNPTGVNIVLRGIELLSLKSKNSLNIIPLWLHHWEVAIDNRGKLGSLVGAGKDAREEGIRYNQMVLEYCVSQMLLINALLENFTTREMLCRFNQTIKDSRFQPILEKMSTIRNQDIERQVRKYYYVIENAFSDLKPPSNERDLGSSVLKIFDNEDLNGLLKQFLKHFFKLVKTNKAPSRIIKLLDCYILSLQPIFESTFASEVDKLHEEMTSDSFSHRNHANFSTTNRTSKHHRASESEIATPDAVDAPGYGAISSAIGKSFKEMERSYDNLKKGYEADLTSIADSLSTLFPDKFSCLHGNENNVVSILKKMAEDENIGKSTTLNENSMNSSERIEGQETVGDLTGIDYSKKKELGPNDDLIKQRKESTNHSGILNPILRATSKQTRSLQGNRSSKCMGSGKGIDLSKANSIAFKAEPVSAVSIQSFDVHMNINEGCSGVSDKAESLSPIVYFRRSPDVGKLCSSEIEELSEEPKDMSTLNASSNQLEQSQNEAISAPPIAPPAPPLPPAQIPQVNGDTKPSMTNTLKIPDDFNSKEITTKDIFNGAVENNSLAGKEMPHWKLYYSPSKRLKQLHWKNLEVPVERTLWNRPLADPFVLSIKLNCDGILNNLETCFAMREAKKFKKKDSTSNGFMPPDLQQYFGIRLHRFVCLSSFEIASKFYYCDSDILELIDFFVDRKLFFQDSLKKNLSTFRTTWNNGVPNYNRGLLELTKWEQVYVLLIIDTESYYEKRMKSLKVMSLLDQNHRDLQRQIRKIHCTLLDIKTSTNFKYLLNLILLLGNYMNDTPRQRQGFKIDSLQRLSMIKNEENGLTLLHTVEGIIRKCFPELEEFLHDLANVPEVVKVNFDQLEQDCLSLGQLVKETEEDFSEKGELSGTKALHPDDRIREIITPWIPSAKGITEKLKSDLMSMKETFECTLTMFGENSDSLASGSYFFESLHEFLKEYNKVKQANLKFEEEERIAHVRLKALEATGKKDLMQSTLQETIKDENAVMDNLLKKLKQGKCDVSRLVDYEEELLALDFPKDGNEANSDSNESMNSHIKRPKTVVLKAQNMLKQLK